MDILNTPTWCWLVLSIYLRKTFMQINLGIESPLDGVGLTTF